MERSILITGASSGIGWATALELASSNNQLVLSGRRQDRLEELASACRGKGCLTRTHAVDLTNEAAIDELAGLWLALPGKPVLINCAGVGIFQPFDQLPWTDFKTQI